MRGRVDVDWLWCAACGTARRARREWLCALGVSDVWAMLSLHRYWHCCPTRPEADR